MVCHGTDGGGDAALGYPRLAGLNAAYIQRQLDDIADGTRKNAMMQPTASALSEDEREALYAEVADIIVDAEGADPRTVADEVAKRYPDKVVETLAYQYTRKPPKHTRVRPNVMPCLCSI